MGRHKKVKRIIAYDSEAFVEKTKEGKIEHKLAYGAFAYKVNGKYKTKVIRESWEFVEFLKKLPNSIVYIHNAKYDLSLLRLTQFRPIIKIISLDKPINVVFKFGVKVRDSLNYLDGKLDSLRKTFLRDEDYTDIGVPKEYKDEAPYYLLDQGQIKEWNKWVSTQGPTLAKNDALILLKVMERFHELFGEIRTEVSLPSIAFNLNRKILKESGADYFKVIYPLYYHPSREANGEEAIQSYKGGRTEALKITRDSVYLTFYDVNSLYPTVMYLFNYPVKFKDEVRRDPIKAYQDNLIGIHLVKWKCDNDFMPIVIRTEVDNDEAVTQKKEGEQWITTPELEVLYKECVGDVEVKRNLWFTTYPIFKAFISRYYELKQKAKKGTPEYLLYKKLMNSLYGKWGQHKERRMVVEDERTIELLERKFMELGNEERIELEDGIVVTRVDKGFFTYREELRKRKNVVVASLVTGLARTYLYHIINSVGWRNVFYCDTDSIAIKVKPPETLNFRILGVRINQPFEGEELGSLKKEKEGWFQIKGKKFYYQTSGPDTRIPIGFSFKEENIAEGQKGEHMVLKGVPSKSKIRLYVSDDINKFKAEAEYPFINAKWNGVVYETKVKEIHLNLKLDYRLEDGYYQGYAL